MENKVEIKQSGYILDNLKRPIILTDENETQYRISFLNGGGLAVNKLGGTNLTDQIYIQPRTTNEINIS